MRLRDTYSADRVHDRWESVYRGNPSLDGFNDAIADRIFEHLEPPPRALFLDAGCGVGDHTIRIARRGYGCVGVDISESVLRKASRKAADSGVESSVSFTCQALEDLCFREASFEVVHCRGVLMHIPDWKKALENLCKVLKPGGRIVVVENNRKSVETAIVLFVRRVQARRSKLVRAPGGLEFWSSDSGLPFVARIADVCALTKELESHGITIVGRFATGFWDVGRFPAGVVRRAVIQFNRLYFFLGFPPTFSMGNAIIGEKRRDQP